MIEAPAELFIENSKFLMTDCPKMGSLASRFVIFVARQSWKSGTKSLRLGKMYETTVRATRQVSATIADGAEERNGSFTRFYNSFLKARFSAFVQNCTKVVTLPSTLSHIASNKLAAFVFIHSPSCLSHVSSAKLTNSSGALNIPSNSNLVVRMQFKHTWTISCTLRS